MAYGTLYVVATPIGNLDDITLRALKVLKSADRIAAEDTRHTIKLLNHYEIKNKLISFHEHSDAAKVDEILAMLQSGLNIALVSDAGTPLVSDPGAALVTAAIENGVDVTPLPGACAAIAAISASGLLNGGFVFEGFLPTKNTERKAVLARIAKETRCTVLYEAPHRITRTLKLLAEYIGGGRQVVLAREMTKMYEEFIRGSVDDVATIATTRQLKGEMVLMIGGANVQKADVTDEAIIAELKRHMATGATKKDAVKSTASSLDVLKNRVYQLSITL